MSLGSSFLIKLSIAVSKFIFGSGRQFSSYPKRPLVTSRRPRTFCGLFLKYSLMCISLSSTFLKLVVFTNSLFNLLSKPFLKKTISVTTSVFASLENALFGSLTAPKNVLFAAILSLTLLFLASKKL